MESQLDFNSSLGGVKMEGVRETFDNSSMGSNNKLGKWTTRRQAREQHHVSSLDREDLSSSGYPETNPEVARTSNFNSDEFTTKRTLHTQCRGSRAGFQTSPWEKHPKATMRFDPNEESDSGLSDINSDWEIEPETDETNLDIDIPEFPRFSPMSSADFDNLIDSLLSTYLPPHSVALQHEISAQKLALSSLQTEHNKLLVAFRRSETRAGALERKHAVWDTEILSLVEDKTRLQHRVRVLEVDFEDLESKNDDCLKMASDERNQFAKILRKAGDLERKGLEDVKKWKRREKELEAKIEVLMTKEDKEPTPSVAKLSETHQEVDEDTNQNEISAKDMIDREQSPAPTDCKQNVIDWSTYHSWYSTTTRSIAEGFENRISTQYEEDPPFAEALKSKLQGKFSFILPFLDGDCEALFEDPNFTSTPQGSDTSSSTSNYRSSFSYPHTTSSSRTSFTSSAPKRQSNEDDENDEVEQQGKHQKRRKPNSSREDPSKRQRLRCHFHAFCPESHTKKTCMVSGWLSIHNLRGHYDSHHTVIRCNKCFQKFKKKTERNVHSKACFRIENSPTLDIIDCDKADEIDENIKQFRTWKLENEEDLEMKNWITKYESEITHKTKGDTRELAKWYTYWRILFPNDDSIVPTPFYTAALLPSNQTLERWLEVFQSLVETKVEHNDFPPPDMPAQAEYYKEVIREVYNLISGPSRSSRERRGSTFGSRSPETLENSGVSHSSGTPRYILETTDESMAKDSFHLEFPERSDTLDASSFAVPEEDYPTMLLEENTDIINTSFLQGPLNQSQNVKCKWCLDMGYINFGANTEHCFSCNVANDVTVRQDR